MNKRDMNNILVVGGLIDGENSRPSGVIRKLGEALSAKKVANGESNALQTSLAGHNVVIWAPDVPNEEPKDYPKKDKGTILICTKIMREDYTILDSVGRIFKMHGNAVVEIYRTKNRYSFRLVDALANIWVETSSIEVLSEAIMKLVSWTQGSLRVETRQSPMFTVEPAVNLALLSDTTKRVAQLVENSNIRYFGNVSTRCAALFPSTRAFVSVRNLNKKYITKDDFVQVQPSRNMVLYSGDRKPSVDTPVQLALYDQCPDINVMIHGHATIEGSPVTENYYPCGDMREFKEILALNPNQVHRINLRNHGFLITAKSLEHLNELISKCIMWPLHRRE